MTTAGAAWRFMLACGLLAWAGWCGAQADPPARMGRLSLVVGSVQAQVEDGAAWAPAPLNLPLGGISRVRTGAQSRAEVRVGSVAVQLDADTMLVLRTVDDNRLEFVLFRGAMALQVPGLAAGQRVSVQGTPGPSDAALAFVVSSAGPGRFHFVRQASGPGFDVQVLEGQGRVLGGASPVPAPVDSGRRVSANVTERSVVEVGEARESPFTDWARQRALRVPDAQTLRHISAEMTGAEELDKHGAWTTDPRWGALWLPAGVDAEWAPYRHGRWVHTTRRGWTWVDDAPWGFAPFHYGRWLFHAGRWAWSPGARVERPVYAPALVGFYDSASTQPAWIGWFPLAPGEAYRPAFKAGPEFLKTLNAPAFERLVATGLRYANTLFAATAMARGAFVAGQPAEAAPVRLSPAMLSSAGVLELHAPPVPAPASAPAPATSRP